MREGQFNQLTVLIEQQTARIEKLEEDLQSAVAANAKTESVVASLGRWLQEHLHATKDGWQELDTILEPIALD